MVVSCFTGEEQSNGTIGIDDRFGQIRCPNIQVSAFVRSVAVRSTEMRIAVPRRADDSLWLFVGKIRTDRIPEQGRTLPQYLIL
jgi:hypothetical protein